MQNSEMLSRNVFLILLWTVLIHQATVYSTIDLMAGIIGSAGGDITHLLLSLLVVQGLCFLTYPLFGLAADIYWTRYKTMYAGTCIQLVGTICLVLVSFILYFVSATAASSFYMWTSIVVAYALIQIGLALVESNAIQFGTDQMLTASSDQLSSFVYWYFWAIFVGHFAYSCFKLMLAAWVGFSQAQAITLLCACCIQLLSIGILLPILLLARRHFVLESTKNPLKGFCGVLKYAVMNKKPRGHRSAFTYGELYPSRMDMAKERFGGKFTTEEVEDVKTILRILLVMVALVGFSLADETASTSAHMTVIFGDLSQSVWHQFITSDKFGISTTVIVVCIPVYQLVFVRRLYRYIPTMLKRIFVGLLLSLLGTVSLQIIEIFISLYIDQNYSCERCDALESLCNITNENSTMQYIVSQNYLVIPQILNGLSFLFIFLTIMEFILAQSPRYMQGFLIGIWYSMQFLTLLISAVESFGVINCWAYLTGVKASVMLLLIPVFVVVGIKYRRRIREESSTVNEYAIIENYYERQLVRHDNQKEEEITMYHSIESDYLHAPL